MYLSIKCYLQIWVVNGKRETLREPETFRLFKLRDGDFKVFRMRARDVQTVRHSDVKSDFETFPLQVKP